MPHMRPLAPLLAFCILASASLADQPVPTLPAGVAVFIPAPEADTLIRATNNGRVLVHAIAADEKQLLQTRDALQQAGVWGIASVVLTRNLTPLPYADNLLNLLVIDEDALHATFPDADLLRVLAPNGVAIVRRNQKQITLVKPRDKGLDDWTHFDYDAAGAGVSRDKFVAPPNHIQWRSEAQEYLGLGGNPAGYRPYTGFRIAQGRAFALYGGGTQQEKKREVPVFLVARDAFNGVPLWKIPAYSSGNGTAQEFQFVVSTDRVFTFLQREGPLVAIDAATGNVIKQYEKAGKLPGRGSKASPAYNMFRHVKGLLVQTAENRLLVLDENTGDIKWQHEEKQDWLCFPRVIESQRRVLVHAVEAAAGKIQGRWANLPTTALLCFDLDTGKLLWRSEETKGSSYGQSIWAADRIFLFCPAGIGASENWGNNTGRVLCLNSADGKLIWQTPDTFKWGYNLLVRDGQPYFATPDSLNQLNLQSGALETFWKAPYNNRCNRTSATGNWIIMGLGIFIDRQGVADVRSISRSGCAQGAFPANGLTYFTPNTCWCFTMLRGHLALCTESAPVPLPDEQRLDNRPTHAAYHGKSTDLTGAIASEWTMQIAQSAKETPPVTIADKSLVALIHEGRLECRDTAGKVIWAFTAGGRISQPPVVHENRVLFGSHDGYAYCLDATQGQLLWRFLAGPRERLFVSHGQVESSAPVYNVVIHNGLACFTAGLHPEIGGGIQAWGLDIPTGRIAWRKVFARSRLLAKTGTKIAPNRVLNSPVTIANNQLAITGLAWSPNDPDDQIQKQIDTASQGDKNRNLGWTIRGTTPEKR